MVNTVLCFIEILVINTNSVDPDQMPHSLASDLGLHCWPITISRVSQLKLVKLEMLLFFIDFKCIILSIQNEVDIPHLES